MKDIRQIHKKAMELARQSESAQALGDTEYSRALLEEAFILEKEAAEDLANESDAEPTRSVLFRSAANLAFRLAHYDEALRLIEIGLGGNPFPELARELRQLRQQINGREVQSAPFIVKSPYDSAALYSYLDRNLHTAYSKVLTDINYLRNRNDTAEQAVLRYLADVQIPKIIQQYKTSLISPELWSNEFAAEAIARIWEYMLEQPYSSNLTTLLSLIRTLSLTYRRIALHYIRKVKIENDLKVRLGDILDLENESSPDDSRTRMYKAIAELESKVRQILLLKIDGRSNREIAEQLGITPESVSNLVYGAIRKLRKKIN